MSGAPNSASYLTDEIVAAAASGAESASATIASALSEQSRLMVAARLIPNAAQAQAVEDIAQLSVASLTTSLTRLEKRTVNGLKAYFSGIVAHKVADYLRQRGPKEGQVSLDTTIHRMSHAAPLWQLLSASGTSPLSAVDRADQIVLMMNELGKLKPEHRNVITLAFFDQLPTGEIARKLDVSRPAASMLLIRAIKALRRNMTGSSELH